MAAGRRSTAISWLFPSRVHKPRGLSWPPPGSANLINCLYCPPVLINELFQQIEREELGAPMACVIREQGARGNPTSPLVAAAPFNAPFLPCRV